MPSWSAIRLVSHPHCGVDRGNPVRYDGENWYHVEGIQLGTTGVELGRRQVLVRGRRLPP